MISSVRDSCRAERQLRTDVCFRPGHQSLHTPLDDRHGIEVGQRPGNRARRHSKHRHGNGQRVQPGREVEQIKGQTQRCKQGEAQQEHAHQADDRAETPGNPRRERCFP